MSQNIKSDRQPIARKWKRFPLTGKSLELDWGGKKI